jgi:hypothetical protein
MISTTTDDLQARLQSMDEKLASIVAQSVTESDSAAAELQLIEVERQSTQQCLEICTQLSEHINQLRFKPIYSSDRGTGPVEADLFSEQITKDGLQECRTRLSATSAKLEAHMDELVGRLVDKSKTAAASEDDTANLARMREEWVTVRQSLHICSDAENRLKENISIIDNYATGDRTIQFLVSTSNKTIHGKNRGFGLEMRQVGGHLNDDSVQRLSQDFLAMALHGGGNTIQSEKTPWVPDEEGKASSSDSSARQARGVKPTAKSNPAPGTTSQPPPNSGLKRSTSKH